MADTTFDEVNLSILGVASEYPPYVHDSSVLEKMYKQHYPKNAAMDKICMINRYTGIETRSAIGPADYPLANMDRAPNISELCEVFRKDGVAMAVAACRKAIQEAQITPADITHIVATTCTNSANPGFDHQLMMDLGITHPVEKFLLQGIGCSGGLAGLRTAANLALGHTFRGRPARILVVAAEICSLLIRSELDSIYEQQETRIGVTLFSDCASALVLSNGLGPQQAEPVYELLGWDHRVIPNSHRDLRFDAHPNGWKVALSPEVPKLACEIVGPSFEALMKSLPNLPPNYKNAADFDWALHPGGSTILTGVERRLGLTPEHMRGSYAIYMKHGNSSSATIFSVLSRFREKDMDECAPGGKVKDFVVACAFGPGVTIETCMLKRNLNHVARPQLNLGEITPPETESEGSRSETEDFDADNIQLPVESAKILETPRQTTFDREDTSVSELREIEVAKSQTETLQNEAPQTTIPIGSAESVGELPSSSLNPALSCHEESFVMDVLNGVELD